MALAIALSGPAAFAQRQDGLTQDFDKLSSKERIKLAKQETVAAAGDSAYQEVMRHAEAAFQAGAYEQALADFKQAREMRPYNVYPKVKIQDLQALIAKKQAAAQAADTTAKASPPASAPTATPPVADPVHGSPPEDPVQQRSALPEREVSKPRSTQEAVRNVPQEKAPPARPVKVAVTTPPAAPNPVQAPPLRTEASPGRSGLGERVFMEAGAVVTERAVEQDGHVVLWRRVVHPSGQVYLFKDGRSITQREWDARFGQ